MSQKDSPAYSGGRVSLRRQGAGDQVGDGAGRLDVEDDGAIAGLYRPPHLEAVASGLHGPPGYLAIEDGDHGAGLLATAGLDHQATARQAGALEVDAS